MAFTGVTNTHGPSPQDTYLHLTNPYILSLINVHNVLAYTHTLYVYSYHSLYTLTHIHLSIFTHTYLPT